MEQMIFKDRPQAVNTAWLTCLSLLGAIQFLVVIVLIYSFIPIKLNDFVKTLLPLYWDQVRPEREMFFYVLFIIVSVALQLGGMIALRSRINDAQPGKSLKPLVIVEAGWVVLQIAAIFKIILFNDPHWARGMLYAVLVLSFLSKVFWPEINRWLSVVYAKLADTTVNWKFWVLGVDIAMPILLMALLYTPDINKVLAHVFAWDSFFHLDAFVMAPGWAYLNDLSLDMDINSNYNVLIPALWAKLSQLTGGFNYAHVMQVLIVGGICYYIGFYFLLRAWSSSALIAVVGVLLAVKLQLFHWGIWPLVWRYPSATPLRHFFDLLVFFLLARHAITSNKKMLWLASLSCGMLLAYSLEVGVYASLAFGGYVAFQLLMPHTRQQLYKGIADTRPLLALLALPWVSGFILLWLVQGPSVFSVQFWSNMTEFGRLFLNGWAALPVTDGLKDKQYFAFIMGFIIPAVYVATMMGVGVLAYLNKIRSRNTYMLFVCLYGLGLYHYFIYRSGVTSYYAVVIPFVMVCCFWLMKLTAFISLRARRICLGLLGVVTFWTLISSYLFTFYPNALNLGGFDFTPEINAYAQNFDVADDAAFIKRMTRADQKVPLISSEETHILIEANRKPFFYFFPLIHTVPLTSNNFEATDLITTERMRRTLTQLETEKPERVFVEKKLFLGQLPAGFYEHFQTLSILLQYLQTHYGSEGDGHYLMSLKRKGAS